MQQLHPKAVWLFFLHSFFALLIPSIVLPIYIIGILVSLRSIGMFNFYFWPSIFGIIISIILSFILAKLSYRFWKYQLSEDAVRIEKGIIRKKYISIPYERIQNVDIYRGIFARILGLSDLHIQTAGYSAHGKVGMGSEGRIPGLDVQIAEQLRDELIKRTKGSKQGL